MVLKEIELDDISIRALGMLAQDSCGIYTVDYIAEELGVDWREVSRRMHYLAEEDYVEYCGIGRGKTEGFSISPQILESPLRTRFL